MFCSTGEAKAEVTLYILEVAAGLLRINTDALMILSSTLEGATFCVAHIMQRRKIKIKKNAQETATATQVFSTSATLY